MENTENVLRGLIYGGQVSLTLADTTKIVQEGIQLHKLSPASALVFGKAISAMTFMSACLKSEKGEISLSVQSDGACGGVGVSGNRNLFLRGYIENTQCTGEETDAFGKNGALTIIRDDGYNRPFVGSCAFPNEGGVDGAFLEYFKISEQLPTYLKTTVELNENGNCEFAGVVALQPLPFAEEAVKDKTENANLQEILQDIKEKGVQETANLYFTGEKSAVTLRKAIYRCNCSRDYLTRVLVTLRKEQVENIIQEDGAVRVHCHYCNRDYEFTKLDAEKLF